MMFKIIEMFKNKLFGVSVCPCCNGTGTYDEGYGPEECSCCSGSGYED